MKNFAVFLLNLLFLIIITLIIRSVTHINLFAPFNLGYFTIEAFAALVSTIFIFIPYSLLFKFFIKNVHVVIKSILTGVLGVLTIFVYSISIAGFTFNEDVAKKLSIYLIVGLILPFSEKWIRKLLTKK